MLKPWSLIVALPTLRSLMNWVWFIDFLLDSVAKTALLEPRTKYLPEVLILLHRVEYETVYPDNVSGWIKH